MTMPLNLPCQCLDQEGDDALREHFALFHRMQELVEINADTLMGMSLLAARAVHAPESSGDTGLPESER